MLESKHDGSKEGKIASLRQEIDELTSLWLQIEDLKPKIEDLMLKSR